MTTWEVLVTVDPCSLHGQLPQPCQTTRLRSVPPTLEGQTGAGIELLELLELQHLIIKLLVRPPPSL